MSKLSVNKTMQLVINSDDRVIQIAVSARGSLETVFSKSWSQFDLDNSHYNLQINYSHDIRRIDNDHHVTAINAWL
jgi:hypothetical protein